MAFIWWSENNFMEACSLLLPVSGFWGSLLGLQACMADWKAPILLSSLPSYPPFLKALCKLRWSWICSEAEDSLNFLIFLPLPLKYWDDRCAPLHLASVVLGAQPRVLRMLVSHSLTEPQSQLKLSSLWSICFINFYLVTYLSSCVCTGQGQPGEIDFLPHCVDPGDWWQVGTFTCWVISPVIVNFNKRLMPT